MGYAERIKLLLEWAPVLNYIMAITAAPPGRERVYRALELCDYLTNRTPTPIDNELLALVRGVLLTPQGGTLLDYLAARLQPLFEDTQPIRLYQNLGTNELR